MPKEPHIEPYDGFDPEQNPLLNIKLSDNHPVARYDLAQANLAGFKNIIEQARDFVELRKNMDDVEYITSSNYWCLNPIEKTEKVRPVEQNHTGPGQPSMNSTPQPESSNKKRKPKRRKMAPA